MTNLPIYDKTGAQVGSYELDLDAMAPKVSKQLLHDAVVMYQANLRQGSAKTKTRSEVSGSRKKMYRQKGTGNARAGHKRSGVRRGGGHIFAKTPKDWSYRLPRKALQLATRMAMAEKVRAEFVKVIDFFKSKLRKRKSSPTSLASSRSKRRFSLSSTNTTRICTSAFAIFRRRRFFPFPT